MITWSIDLFPRPMGLALVGLGLAFGSHSTGLSAQRSVGLFQNDEAAFEGYTMIGKGGMTYLIDNAGLIVHTWLRRLPGSHPGYLMDDGSLLSTSGTTFDFIDWDSKIIWGYNNPTMHHDIEPLPNGNVLVLTLDKLSAAEAVAIGRNPAQLDDTLDVPVILEIAFPGTVVWEWHLSDHLVQDFDSNAPNFGVVSDSEELVDLNYTYDFSNDWIHDNGLAYNPSLDQIMISSRFFNEFWIIDHSTSTAQAAGHVGGASGRGGDLIYRWGNPEAYGAGTLSDRQLFGQHHAHWIPPGLVGAGNVLVFNNGGPGSGRGDFSSVDEMVLPINGNGYSYTPGNAYAPALPIRTYMANPVTDFYSFFLSSAQRLPNGNTLIDQGMDGTIFEVTSAGQVVWKYVSPVTFSGILGYQDIPGPQGPGLANRIFRATRYAPDHPAFVGQDLTPTQALEGYGNFALLTLESSSGGVVSSRDEGTYTYGEGQLVTLQASADPGFQFSGWSVELGSAVLADASAAHTTLVMGAGDLTVRANFDNAIPASGAAFNGSGANPTCLASSPPVIGQDWNSTIDASVLPTATTTFMAIRAMAGSGTFLAGGELLLDLQSARFLTTQAPVTGGSGSILLAVPSDPTLAGLNGAAQGIVFGGGYRLCNAYQFTVGF